MHKIVLADNQAIFRAGMAKVLAMEDSLRIIAQCPDGPTLFHAIATFRGSIVIAASSMAIDLAELIAKARLTLSRVIVIAENGEEPSSAELAELQGRIYRDVSSAEVIDCVRKVIQGERSIHPAQANPETHPEDLVGARVRDRLTPKEMKIVALIVQGCKNREIGVRLGTTEQVIKNYLRNIFDKTGVSDRLELALFTIHHRTLAAAATAVGESIDRAELATVNDLHRISHHSSAA